MSTILKALRRLEEDKRSQTAMSLDEAVVEPQSTSGGSGRAIVFATAASALAGVAALLWATSGLWLPGGEGKPNEVVVASQPVPAVPAPIAAAPAAQLPPVSPPIPIRAPAQTGAVEAFENPEKIRREMQRLASPDAMEATLDNASPAREVAAAARPAPVARPKPKAAPAKAPIQRKPKAIAVASKPAPAVSARASVGPVEVIRRDAAQGVSIRQISWHPRPDRRVATFVVEGKAGAIPRREGEKVAGYTIEEIGISEVELVRDGVSVRRRVGN